MTIHQISNDGSILFPVKTRGKKTEQQTDDVRKDHVNLSDEAKALYESEQSQHVQQIRERIRSGYYFQRDVTEEIADGMIAEIAESGQ